MPHFSGPWPAGTSPITHLLSDSALGARQLDVPPETVLFEPGAPATNLYFIHSGQVRIYQVGPDDSARLAEILGPGDWFGVAALAQARGYTSRALAVSRSNI